MYKWHVHSAIGRGRPISSDFNRVADGIAASLRQFSISTSNCAEEDGNKLRITRTQRSADAFKEVSSLASRPQRGVDARSLGATPPPANGRFTITRVQVDGPSGYRGQSDGPARRPNFGSGRGGFVSRGGPRGGARGRGRGRGRGARRGNRGGKREARAADDDGWIEAPHTEEELAYLNMSEGGFPTDWVPETSAKSLARYGPAVMSSPRGIVETVANRIMVATAHTDPSFEHASIHMARMDEELGTLFEDAEQKALTEEYNGSKQFIGLSETQKKNVMDQWVGGKYTAPGIPAEGNVLARIRQMARRNETYLPNDMPKFEKTLRSLLPQNMRQAEYHNNSPESKTKPVPPQTKAKTTPQPAVV